jgi:hypothetical protein
VWVRMRAWRRVQSISPVTVWPTAGIGVAKVEGVGHVEDNLRGHVTPEIGSAHGLVVEQVFCRP